MLPDQPASSRVFPTPLMPGDLIGVIAPSSPQREDSRLRTGIRFLEDAGYRIREGAHVWDRHGYLAGTDQDRLSDLNGMLRDPEVRLITSGRGGYGATRILKDVDYDAARQNRPIILGFSDVTALNLAMLAKADLVTFSGTMPGVDLWQGDENDAFAIEQMWGAITGSTMPGQVSLPDAAEPTKTLRDGVASGPLLPANLTLLASLCGTPYLPDFKGAILLLEEIGEEVYRVDRLLSQLENAGILDDISGLAYGRFTGTEPTRISIDPLELDEVLNDYANRAHVPTISGISYGHIRSKLTLPVGALCRMEASKDRAVLTLLESGTTPE